MATRDVHRVVVYRAADGWRWKAQGRNWRTVGRATRAVARPATATRHAARLYPGVEVVVR